MKTLDLNAYGVSEMNQQELETTDGGWWPLVVVAALFLSSCIGSNNKMENKIEVTVKPCGCPCSC